MRRLHGMLAYSTSELWCHLVNGTFTMTPISFLSSVGANSTQHTQNGPSRLVSARFLEPRVLEGPVAPSQTLCGKYVVAGWHGMLPEKMVLLGF